MIFDLLLSQETESCRLIKIIRAIKPFVNAIVLSSMVEARVVPIATVTIKSKAFIEESVLLPDNLRINTRRKYNATAVTAILIVSSIVPMNNSKNL